MTNKEKIVGKFGKNVKEFIKPSQKFSMPNNKDKLRIVIATDAWHPQVNGVVRTLQTLGTYLESFGNEVLFITPEYFKTFPMPSYPEIRVAIMPNAKAAKMINEFKPDAIHIPTEGPIGHAVRRFCLRRKYPFTTSFHTKFPEYINARIGVPLAFGYSFIRNFHKPSQSIMVSTNALKEELEGKNFHNLKLWERGIDLDQFVPTEKDYFNEFKKPYWLYVGRVAVEKNIETFLKLNLKGTKIIVGDGPQLNSLRKKYPDAQFLGPRFGKDLARCYSSADVFVFPSLTDTFGLVNVEALACGTPVAAFPVRGPMDILANAPSGCGVVNDDLAVACEIALKEKNSENAIKYANNFSWKSSTRQFISNLAMAGYDEEFWLKSANIPE